MQAAHESLQQALNVQKNTSAALRECSTAISAAMLSSVQTKRRKKKSPLKEDFFLNAPFLRTFEEMLLYLPLQRWDILLFQLKAKPQSLHQTVTKPLMIFHFVLRLHAVKLTHVPFFPNLIPRQTTSNASLRLPYINSNTTL